MSVAVDTYNGVPPASAFGNTKGQGTPLVINIATGVGYFQHPVTGAVTALGGGGGGGGGTVTSFSFVNANGFTGSVANATTTPALTLTGGPSTAVLHWTEASSTSIPNGTVGATSWQALSSLSDADACIIPKGNGALVAAIPDGIATGGNKRGLNAVDLQLSRSSPLDVAVNQWSAIVGGRNSRAAGNSSFIGAGNNNQTNDTDTAIVGGRDNSVTGICSFIGAGGSSGGNTINAVGAGIIGGYSNFLTGTYGFIAGGQANTVSGAGAVMLGGSNASLAGANSVGFGSTPNDNSRRDVFIHAITPFAAGVPAQFIRWGGSSITTNATPTVLSPDRSLITATNQFVLRNDTTAMIRGIGVARRNSTGDQYNFTFVVSINRGGNAAATTVDVATVTDIFKSAGAASWSIAFAANTTLGGLTVTFTGAASQTIRCAVFLEAVEVTG